MADTIKEVLEMHARMINGGAVSKYEAKAQSLAEIKRIVEETKPDQSKVFIVLPEGTEGYTVDGIKRYTETMLDEYHTNLMKALGEE